MEDIERAAADKGAEPLYTQAFWRAAVLVLLARRNDRISIVLTELLRLYDWRKVLGEKERAFVQNPASRSEQGQMDKWLRQYGREKTAAWDEARAALADRSGWLPPGQSPVILHVYKDADSLLIFGVHGCATIDALQQIEAELSGESAHKVAEPGEYLIKVDWFPPQREAGTGRIELAGGWECNVLDRRDPWAEVARTDHA